MTFNSNKYEDMNKDGFLFEVQRLAFELEALIDKYGVRDEVVNVLMTGVMEKTDEGTTRLRAIYSYSIDSQEELEDVLEFINDTWVQQDLLDDEDDIEADLDDLLDGTGIELE